MAILNKSKLRDKDKSRWMKVMTPDFMLSDYSESDGDNLLTRPLHWRATRVSDFLSQLDRAADERKSSQARKQTKSRHVSYESSTRNAPSGPAWAINGQ